MLRLDSTLSHALVSFAAVLSLSTGAAAQTYTARAGDSIGGGGNQSTGSYPVTAFWDGTWAHSTRHAWSKAHGGSLECTALCTVDGFYNMAAYAIAEFAYDDLIFTSAGSSPIQVGLKLTIEGNSSVINGNLFRVALRHAGTQVIGQATLSASGMVNSSGGLSGWSMTTGHSFVHVITVPVNTPVSLRLHMDASASAVAGGHEANGHYTLRLGGMTPTSGNRYEVFDLPSGVRVDSVTARISDNLWRRPERLHLSSSDVIVGSGGSLRLTAWNGVPGAPVALSIGSGPAPLAPDIGPSIWRAQTGSLGAEGGWRVDPIQNSPALAGSTMHVRAHSVDVLGQPTRSRRITIQFQ